MGINATIVLSKLVCNCKTFFNSSARKCSTKHVKNIINSILLNKIGQQLDLTSVNISDVKLGIDPRLPKLKYLNSVRDVVFNITDTRHQAQLS